MLEEAATRDRAGPDDVTGVELWQSDGTEAGTVLVKDINPAGGSNPEKLTAVNGSIPLDVALAGF